VYRGLNARYIVHDAKLQQIIYIANDLSKKAQKFFILQSVVYKMAHFVVSGSQIHPTTTAVPLMEIIIMLLPCPIVS